MGGGRAAHLRTGRIDPGEALRGAASPKGGAVALFLGTVRDNGKAGRVRSIEYEAYAAMAEKVLARTEAEVRRRWPGTAGVRILHRVGRVRVGEVSVAIAVSSPHRAEAFEACRFAIEAIKHAAPIWKRERLTGGRDVWVGGVPIGSAGARGGR